MNDATEDRMRSYLVRERDVLLTTCRTQQLVRDVDLHLLACEIRHEPLVRSLLLDGLSALALHLSTRSPDEHVGWTISLPDESINLFFTGDAGTGRVVGRAFTEGVESADQGLFYAQVKRSGEELRQSAVAVEGLDIFGFVERFWEQSEQRPARFVHRPEGDSRDVVFLTGLPGVDEEWLRQVPPEEVFALREGPAVGLLAERPLRFACGCDQERVAGVLVGAYGSQPEVLFGDEPSVSVECPRCGASYAIHRRDYEQALARRSS